MNSSFQFISPHQGRINPQNKYNTEPAQAISLDFYHNLYKINQLAVSTSSALTLPVSYKMQKKIFITQDMLDKLSAESKIDLQGNKLSILSGEKPNYNLIPAVKFIAIESGDNDPFKLIGKIVPSNILKEKGVEVYMDSAIYKDEAYKVEQGFAGTIIEEGAIKKASPEPVKEIKTDEVPKTDDELLAEFFLKNM